jgi:PiT family inorganic phosphate transporter
LSVTALLWITGAIGLYMAWNIGANDVANAMGTSVGSKALTLNQAVVVAGLLEFAGAVLVGAYVVDTVRKGIVDPQLFASDPNVLICGMMSALAAAAIWLNVATYFGWPVSTTHAIVGAVTGFGVVVVGWSAVNWSKLLFIAASWVVSPVVGGIVSYLVYQLVRRLVIDRRDPAAAAYHRGPLLVGVLLFVLGLVTLLKGLKNLQLDLRWYHSTGISGALGLGGALLTLYRRRGRPVPVNAGAEAMERSFVTLQIATACSVAFAHGANDVANAVGPMAAVYAAVKSGTVGTQQAVPLWIMLMGGVGIVIGLATYGYRVMATIGTRITEMTPSRGFAAEFGAAITILTGSKLGLPLSTTHTLVGSVIGVGFARGLRALNIAVIRTIVVSWVLTVPVAALLSIPLMNLLRWLTSN